MDTHDVYCFKPFHVPLAMSTIAVIKGDYHRADFVLSLSLGLNIHSLTFSHFCFDPNLKDLTTCHTDINRKTAKAMHSCALMHTHTHSSTGSEGATTYTKIQSLPSVIFTITILKFYPYFLESCTYQPSQPRSYITTMNRFGFNIATTESWNATTLKLIIKVIHWGTLIQLKDSK